MKSLTSLVFYTDVVLKIVILFVRLNSVLRRCVISDAGFKILETGNQSKKILQCFFDFTLGVYFEFYCLVIVHYSRLRGYFCLCNIVIEIKILRIRVFIRRKWVKR